MSYKRKYSESEVSFNMEKKTRRSNAVSGEVS